MKKSKNKYYKHNNITWKSFRKKLFKKFGKI